MDNPKKVNLPGTFLELARRGAGKLRDTYIQWCDQCSTKTEQECMDKGIYEIYTCTKCGFTHTVAVR